MTRRRRRPDPAALVLRPLASREDYLRCLALQQETWGKRFSELAPVGVLSAAQRIGGVAVGAFDARHEMLGFVFGLNGVRDGRLAHWSYMLAVRRSAQGQGLGHRLKVYQRELLLDTGIDVAYWTYDPLVAANAHLFVHRLGARPIEYALDAYGRETGSALHRDLGTDRFVVEWRLRDHRVEAALAGTPAPDGTGIGRAHVPGRAPGRAVGPRSAGRSPVLIEIPDDIYLVRARAPRDAARWRRITRRAFRHYLARGYVVSGWRPGDGTRRGAYLLTPP
jgi:predicted GNAT superfamily acetyltransferase